MNPAAPPSATRILVIDDSASIHDDFRKILMPLTVPNSGYLAARGALFGATDDAPPVRREFQIDCAFQGRQGLALVQQAVADHQPYALAFVDMRMPPGWDGIETIGHLWTADPALQVVICTAYSDHSWEETVHRLGDSDNLLILKKPFDNIEVLQLAHSLARKWQLARENLARLASLDELVRKRTRELGHAEERFSQAFNANPHAQALIALDRFEILEINDAFGRQFGLTLADLAGRPAENVGLGTDPAVWRALLQRLARGEPVDDHPLLFQPGAGGRRELRCSARTVTVASRPCSIWLIRDVTAQLELEQQLLHSQKMEAIGQLAAGVAHDFNNLLTVILGYLGLVLDDPAIGPENRAGLIQVRTSADRAAALTRQLLVFSRRQISNPEPINVGIALTRLRDMLSRLLPERIRLELHTPPTLPRVMADTANLEQAVMNLVINARDAIPRDGAITLALREARLEADAPRSHPDARPGHFICLEVRDTGTGIPPGVLEHIFEPFFTTKEVGVGTGLGLSTVYGIVRQHHGWIEVVSQPGAGTAFEIFLPAIDGPSAVTTPPFPVATDGNARGKPGARILIVEDEPAVRFVASAIMRQAGYQVTEAADTPSALIAWEAAQHQFDLVLTDIVMPNGPNGVELACRLRRDKPGLKIVLSTGYSSELLKHTDHDLDDMPMLLKPYTRETMLATLGNLLAQG